MKKMNDILNIEYSNNKSNIIQYSILNIASKRNKKSYSDKQAQQKAMYLADKFHNPSGIQFYLKCAWNLTDEFIDWLADYSLKKKMPAKYFVSVANKEMIKNS